MQRVNLKTSRIDYTLVLLLFLFFLSSCLAIYSAQSTGQYNENFLIKQIFWYGIGVVLITLVIRLDSDQLRKISWYTYVVGNILLLLLILAPSSIAPEINGAKSWFVFPFIGSLQPSELMKIFLIITLANVIATHHTKNVVKTVESDFKLLFKLCVITGVPLLLVMQQPDLGTSLVLLAILAGMIFASGITWKIILPIFGTVTAGGGLILLLVIKFPKKKKKYLGVKEYQLGRIYSWLKPYDYESSTGYHLIKSLLAIGSGETTGKGIGNREVYLPESQTDFIFSVIGEEYGFVGTSIVISLFFLLIYHIMKLALETKNQYYTYICVGVICMITFHVFQNIGMTIGVVPITGIPLPFISYGGSSMMGNMLSMGVIFSIGYHYKKYMFSAEK